MDCMVKNSSTCKGGKQAKHLLLTCSHFWGSAEPKCSRQLLLKDPRIRFGRPEARVAVCSALREVGIESKFLEMNETSAEALFCILLVGDVMSL